MEQKVIYNGQLLVLTQFWATGEPCLWITAPQQIEMPKMEFVGGYPNEYCIFLKNLTETELTQITSLDGTPLDVSVQLSQKSKSAKGTEIRKNKVGYGGKTNGNDCKLSINY